MVERELSETFSVELLNFWKEKRKCVHYDFVSEEGVDVSYTFFVLNEVSRIYFSGTN